MHQYCGVARSGVGHPLAAGEAVADEAPVQGLGDGQMRRKLLLTANSAAFVNSSTMVGKPSPARVLNWSAGRMEP